MRPYNAKVWITPLLLGLLLLYLVACQSDSIPVQPDAQPDHGLTASDGHAGETSLNTRLEVGIDTREPDTEETQTRRSTRLERQRELPAVGELYMEIDTEFPVEAGDEIVVRILVRDIEDMFGCGFEVGFDEEMVEIKEVDLEGCILGDDLISLTQVINPGELPVGITRKKTDEGLIGVSGDGILATVHFTAFADLDISDALNLVILTRDSIPRYTTADLSEVRLEISDGELALIDLDTAVGGGI